MLGRRRDARLFFELTGDLQVEPVGKVDIRLVVRHDLHPVQPLRLLHPAPQFCFQLSPLEPVDQLVVLGLARQDVAARLAESLDELLAEHRRIERRFIAVESFLEVISIPRVKLLEPFGDISGNDPDVERIEPDVRIALGVDIPPRTRYLGRQLFHRHIDRRNEVARASGLD